MKKLFLGLLLVSFASSIKGSFGIDDIKSLSFPGLVIFGSLTYSTVALSLIAVDALIFPWSKKFEEKRKSDQFIFSSLAAVAMGSLLGVIAYIKPKWAFREV